jgi:hypothetical protein
MESALASLINMGLAWSGVTCIELSCEKIILVRNTVNTTTLAFRQRRQHSSAAAQQQQLVTGDE